MDLMVRRNMLMRGGDSTDWKALFMGMVDGTVSGDIVIESGITAIRDYAFYRCNNITSVVIPDSVITVGVSAFYYCPELTEIVFPDSVTSIGGNALSYCSNIRHIVIGTGILTMGNWALGSSTGGANLEDIIIKAVTPPTIFTNTFGYTNNCPIYVPDASVATYKAASNWSALASRIFPLSDLNNT